MIKLALDLEYSRRYTYSTGCVSRPEASPNLSSSDAGRVNESKDRELHYENGIARMVGMEDSAANVI
jgi:hypothetical protein